MGRRAFIGALAGGLLTAPLAAEAQQSKVAKIGVLHISAGLGETRSDSHCPRKVSGRFPRSSHATGSKPDMVIR